MRMARSCCRHSGKSVRPSVRCAIPVAPVPSRWSSGNGFRVKMDMMPWSHGSKVLARATGVFRGKRRYLEVIADLKTEIAAFAGSTPLFDAAFAGEAAEYCFEIVASGSGHPVSAEAASLCRGFEGH
jgi:hypothetical protein